MISGLLSTKMLTDNFQDSLLALEKQKYLENIQYNGNSPIQAYLNEFEVFERYFIEVVTRLYIGQLPKNTCKSQIKNFFQHALSRANGCHGEGCAVVDCTKPAGKNYAFIQLRSIEETSSAMLLDGIKFNNTHLQVRRPSRYDRNIGSLFGPVDPDPKMNLAGLDICKTIVKDSPRKLFIGGLPCEWTSEQVKQELLDQIGQLDSFYLVVDNKTGMSKGYAFCEFVETESIIMAIQQLDGQKLGKRKLSIRLACQGAYQSPFSIFSQPTIFDEQEMPRAKQNSALSLRSISSLTDHLLELQANM